MIAGIIFIIFAVTFFGMCEIGATIYKHFKNR